MNPIQAAGRKRNRDEWIESRETSSDLGRTLRRVAHPENYPRPPPILIPEPPPLFSSSSIIDIPPPSVVDLTENSSSFSTSDSEDYTDDDSASIDSDDDEDIMASDNILNGPRSRSISMHQATTATERRFPGSLLYTLMRLGMAQRAAYGRTPVIRTTYHGSGLSSMEIIFNDPEEYIDVDDYEQLLRLDETIENRRAASKEEIDELPKKKLKTSEEKNCCICLCEIVSGDTIKTLPCQHYFHDTCIDKWLQVNKTCPVDRKPINNK